MMADCEQCKAEGSVDYDEDGPKRDGFALHCQCEVCGAVYEVDPSADFDGECFTDDSGPGRCIKHGTMAE